MTIPIFETMISFGELRKKSVEWQCEIGTVEKIYALDWLLKGIYSQAGLRDALILRGASALSKAYFAAYPRVEDLDFARSDNLDDTRLESELAAAANEAAQLSGLQFRLHSFQPSEARVEFTGPLGRRSAAQPIIILRFVKTRPLEPPASRALIHPFSDSCQVTLKVVSLEEIAAERIILFSRTPRARDVFDLWYILTAGVSELDWDRACALARERARAKGLTLRSQLDPQYAPLLARAWDNALKEIGLHPTFEQAVTEVQMYLERCVSR
ncbi:MAG TPA: nucleotidyl transferase AbiEii/AbiGii toxin family protein [Anaerolineae bacterium]|nr:nucleotidyl transferase AbiEii/AbiGii toxin family protein [Anaerolineae bacterium]